MKVLVIEDEQRVSNFIKKGLEEQGDEVMQAFDGDMGLKLATQYEFDIIVLDIIMPQKNGMEVCHILKNKLKFTTPVLMLTALGTTDDIVDGLDAGADDYLVKPFKFKELYARLKALNRRHLPKQEANKQLKVKDLIVDLNLKEVYRQNELINLTSREFRLLEYLLRNKNKVVSRVDILENVWEINFDLGTNVVDVYINYLRKKIEKPFNSKLINTVIGMGYIIKD